MEAPELLLDCGTLSPSAQKKTEPSSTRIHRLGEKSLYYVRVFQCDRDHKSVR
jgi:hypothetical protein